LFEYYAIAVGLILASNPHLEEVYRVGAKLLALLGKTLQPII